MSLSDDQLWDLFLAAVGAALLWGAWVTKSLYELRGMKDFSKGYKKTLKAARPTKSQREKDEERRKRGK